VCARRFELEELDLSSHALEHVSIALGFRFVAGTIADVVLVAALLPGARDSREGLADSLSEPATASSTAA
jgi:hypothetical protein